jgi:hypothetical protein
MALAAARRAAGWVMATGRVIDASQWQINSALITIKALSFLLRYGGTKWSCHR